MKTSEAYCDSTLSSSTMRADSSNKGLSSYQKEWENLFCGEFYKMRLRSMGMKGALRSSYFRSICWKVYLECLPEDPQMWIDKAKSQRQRYEEILDKFDTNPRCGIKNMDISLNNPLSQSQQSPWNQYFQDTELKVTIEQDVVRTFPEIEFFHTSEIQQMMINILFSYAREFPHISYKQGMHELLAPIIFVLHYDQQAYLHASETDDLELSIHILLNQNYIEHDAFFLFCHLMEAVEEWYTLTDCPMHRKQVDQEPFLNELQSGSNNILGRKLKKIYQHHLKRNDPELFSYLEQMEIAPQIYGIRWLRLLFGREFALHDLLVIWDAIFADSVEFDLVDHLFVAMLVSIKELLMKGDYASSLSHLMRYPHVADVRYIIDLALYLRDPTGYTKPARSAQIIKPLVARASKDSSQSLYKNFSRSIFPGQAKAAKQNVSSKQSVNRPKTLKIARAGSLPTSEPPTLESPKSETEPRLKSASVSDKKLSSSHSPPDENEHSLKSSELDTNLSNSFYSGTSYTLPRTTIRNVMENRDHKFKAADLSQSLGHINDAKSSGAVSAYREMVPLIPPSTKTDHPLEHTDEVEMLKSEISELRSMNQYCVHQMSLHLEKLQETMVSQSLKFEDEMLIALAGIKRARDILKGTVSFTQEVIGDDINPYDHISKNSSTPSKEALTFNEAQPEILEDFVLVQGAMCDGSTSVAKMVDQSDENLQPSENYSDEFALQNCIKQCEALTPPQDFGILLHSRHIIDENKAQS